MRRRRQPSRETALRAQDEGLAPNAAAPQEDVLRLQRSAGNAAVARAILARDEAGGASALAGAEKPKVNLGLPHLGLGGPIMPKPIPMAAEGKIRDWLETRKLGIGLKVQEGTVSMPEVVAQLRREVAESGDVEIYQLEGLVAEVMGRETPPPTRAKKSAGGTESEIAARIANALPKPPKSIAFSSRAGKLELTLDGIEASTKVGGAKVTAQAGKEEAEASVKKGPASVTATAGYKGDSFGLKTQVGDVSFHAKIEKENEAWTKWSMKLSVPLLGTESAGPPPAAALTEAVEKANAAVSGVIAHLRAGGSPTDDAVKKQLEAIKPAIDAVSRATSKPKDPSVTVGVKAEGGGGAWSFGVSLVIEF